MDLVHHYTNYQALECILKNRTLRLNRLDKVDDRQEMSLISQSHWAQYLFVSSWSASMNECEAMWSRYAGYNGIRISLPKFPFHKIQLKSAPELNSFVGDNTYSPIPFELIYNDEWLFVNTPIIPDTYGREVTYSNTPESDVRPIVRHVDGGINFNLYDLATFKDIAWSYQKEFRYIFFIVPSSPDVMANWKSSGDPSFVYQHLFRCLTTQADAPLSYFDIPLGDALNLLEVTIGPKCNETDILNVELLLNEYVPNATIRKSALTGYV